MPFEIVSIAKIHEVVAEAVRAALGPEFEEIGKLRWVRSADAPIRQMFRYQPWKGGHIGPLWGLSLDFVPHITRSEVKWHRTPKSARMDLVVNTNDRTLDMPYHAGPAALAAQVSTVVPAAVSRARVFWDRWRSVPELPAAYDWVRAHYPGGYALGAPHRMSRAFVLAKVGRIQEARVQLEEHFVKGRELEYVEARIRAHFEELCAAPAP